MDNGIGALTLDTLATRADFPNQWGWGVFRKAILKLDHLYRFDIEADWESSFSRPIIATIGWYENQPEGRLLGYLGKEGGLLKVIEDLIERKYQERYGG